eukprot:CAMPEP_0173438440 /NCGR_PEP_ID=MMETSP1357-20121228/20401_1 /TAXON_ID=77926 /ORGANISM="Hemiselmis rufescens, Strain PCC563" /LENGTH=145 /DNA_ID=CAMNT_0014403737 /DNA_START=253 /DNA_END=686 /DNA_ORIENTATION=+
MENMYAPPPAKAHPNPLAGILDLDFSFGSAPRSHGSAASSRASSRTSSRSPSPNLSRLRNSSHNDLQSSAAMASESLPTRKHVSFDGLASSKPANGKPKTKTRSVYLDLAVPHDDHKSSRGAHPPHPHSHHAASAARAAHSPGAG